MNKGQFFRKLYAAIFVIAALTFGVLITIAEKNLFNQVQHLKFDNLDNIRNSLMAIVYLSLNIIMIVVPSVYLIQLFLSANKNSAYKAIFKSANAVLAKFIIAIFSALVILIVIGAPAQYYKDYFFGEESMMIVPAIIFVGSAITLSLASMRIVGSSQTLRAILTTIGSGLAITGLCVYYGFQNIQNNLIIFGLIVAISCYAGLVVYCFLPQSRE